MGDGLTPSFDDFLAGFLSLYNAVQLASQGKVIIVEKREILERTTWLSGSIFHLMENLHVDEIVKDLPCAIMLQSDKVLDGFKKVVLRGHTSGVDMAFGIFSARMVLLQTLANQETTKSYTLSILKY